MENLIAINFFSSKDIDEEHAIYSKTNKIMIYDKADEVIDGLLNHFFQNIKLGCKHQ